MSTVSMAAIREQERRLLRLPFSPQDEDAEKVWKREFERIIKARCDNDAHAIAVVTHLCDNSHRCPPPAAIVEACQQVVPPEAVKAPAGCDLCVDGFQQFQRIDNSRIGRSQMTQTGKKGETMVPLGKPQTVDVADYCVCTKGQWLKAKHAEWRAKEAAKK